MVYGNHGTKLGGSKKKKKKSRSPQPRRAASASPARGKSTSKPRERERERTRSPSVQKSRSPSVRMKSLTRSPSRGRSPTLKPRSRSASVQPRRVRQSSLSIDRMAASGRKSKKTREAVRRAYYAEDGSYIPIAERRKGPKGLPPKAPKKAPPRHQPSSAWKRAEDVHVSAIEQERRSKSQPHGNLRNDTHTPKPKPTEAYKTYRRATSKSPQPRYKPDLRSFKERGLRGKSPVRTATQKSADAAIERERQEMMAKYGSKRTPSPAAARKPSPVAARTPSPVAAAPAPPRPTSPWSNVN